MIPNAYRQANQLTFPACLSTASPHYPLLAALHNSTLTIHSTDTHTILLSISLDPTFAAHCTHLRWYCHPQSASTSSPPPPRLLLASRTTIHIYDAHSAHYHATVSNAALPTAAPAHLAFLSPDTLLLTPSFASKSTLWDLRSGAGIEVRDPKALLRARDACAVRPGSGHVALLTRPAGGRDVVVVLSPDGTGDVQACFVVRECCDARGLRWSERGEWLVVWEAGALGAVVAVYTPEGMLFRRWEEEVKGEEVGLGVERVEWCGGKLCLGMGDGRIVVLDGRTVSEDYPHSYTLCSTPPV